MKKIYSIKGYHRHLIGEAGFNISWSAIFAGVVTFFAILALLSLIGTAIGFGLVDPTSNDPLSGVGTGLLIWTVITMILAFIAGGFVAGMAAKRVGILHGFLTWATNVLVLLITSAFITSIALSAVGTIVGNAFSVIGDASSSVASGITNVVESGIDNATQELDDVYIDTDDLQEQTYEILEDTEVPELQPDYLNNQLDESINEITQAGKDLLLNPENADQILTALSDSLMEKAQTIIDEVDREAIAQSVAANTDLSEAEAREATDNIYNEIETASKQAQEAINEASQLMEELNQDINQTIEDARILADEVADATSKAAIWTFIALFIALILTTLSGIWGSNFVTVRDEESM